MSDTITLKLYFQPDVIKDKPCDYPESPIDIDLTDPGVAKAAVLLQSGFRGLRSRQKFNLKVMKLTKKH